MLRFVNRGCTTRDAQRAIRLLLDAGYKVDGHLMPDLPGSSPEQDSQMLQRMLTDESLRLDQMKLYPHAVVPWTVTKKWMQEGRFAPMSVQALTELLVEFKAKVHPWIRLNRVVGTVCWLPDSFVAYWLNDLSDPGHSVSLRGPRRLQPKSAPGAGKGCDISWLCRSVIP